MCITEEEATCTTDDSGAAAVGIVGVVIFAVGVMVIISGNIVGMVSVVAGVAVMCVAAAMVARKM